MTKYAHPAHEMPDGILRANLATAHHLHYYIHKTPSRPPFDRNQAPTSLKTPSSPHRIYDFQDSLDKLMHFLPQLSDFVPLRNRFYSFRAQTA